METKIVVASANPVKMEAVRRGFARMFPNLAIHMRQVEVGSGVADQPMSEAETLRGALNRVKAAQTVLPDADYWASIEGGVHPFGERLLGVAWVIVMDAAGKIGQARTAGFIVPQEVATLIYAGKELGEADDIVFGRNNSKQDNGAVGILTGDVITRTTYYEHAVIIALMPFKNPALSF